MEKRTIAKESIRDAILEMNGWHPNVPLLLVFSRQKKGKQDLVDGGAQAVGAAYNSLFSLDHVGIADDARKFYLHFCHRDNNGTPHAIRKPTANYGKTHQRIIKDTFGQQFLTRESSGKYKLAENFAEGVRGYLGISGKLDLKPLVFYRFWNDVGDSETVGDLWRRFCDEFGTDREPYDELFQCSSLNERIPAEGGDGVGIGAMKQLVLPSEYGVGGFTSSFWTHFRGLLEARLNSLKWQGNVNELSTNIAAALMQDQSLFLLGDPGTGKTTVVLEGILPALREAVGSENEIGLAYHTLTPDTSASDLFGFQGLDGQWIEGPLVKELLIPYEVSESGGDDSEEEEGVGLPEGTDPRDVPRVLFLDEANRVDVEGLLAPLQASFDRMQKRMEPPTVIFGNSEYVVPRRIWRVFAGNSPAADSGRREQSRPFKRRFSVVFPPDPMDAALEREDAFRRLSLELLEKASSSDDPEVAEPALRLYGHYRENSGRLEDLRQLMGGVKRLKRVAVTVGLVESILLRAAAHGALQPEGGLDAAVTGSLASLVCGERSQMERLIESAERMQFPKLGRMLRANVLDVQAALSTDLDPVL